jgi:lysine biosynthesis protein LysW
MFLEGGSMSKKCPVCNSMLHLTQPVEINQQVVCANCGLELEVVWLYPLELARVSGPPIEENKENKSQKKKVKGLRNTFPAVD